MLTRPLLQSVALLAAVACSDAGDDQALVSVTYFGAPPVMLDMLTVTISVATHQWVWSGSQFITDASNGSPHTPPVETPTTGTLQVHFRLTDGGIVVSSGEVELPLRPDWRWGISLHTETTDPVRSCFGCIGSKAFPLPVSLRTPGRDSIWFVWGGNSIKHPVIF